MDQAYNGAYARDGSYILEKLIGEKLIDERIAMRWLTLLLHLRLLIILSQPIAAIISLQTLQNALSVLGYPAVALFVMIESAGIPFPGETMLLLASFFAATNHTLQIPLVIVSAALGAIIGDNLGYLIGRTGGYALVRRYGKYIFLRQEQLDRAEQFFAKHGDKTVFFGRFVAVLRAWAAFLAGVNHMPWRTFFIYNAAGGIIWATIYGTLGFVAGRYFHDNFSQIQSLGSTIGWVGGGIIVAAAIALFIFFRVRRRNRQREAAVTHAQKEAQDDASNNTTASGATTPGAQDNASDANDTTASGAATKAPEQQGDTISKK
jgi:membrane protein DedA with SNARE-associated domain